MSYTITLTNRVDIGSNSEFKNYFQEPIVINPNSYVQLVNCLVEKTNGGAPGDGLFLTVPELSFGNTYWANQSQNSAKNGCIALIGDFPNVTGLVDDKLSISNNYPKISLNNAGKIILNSLTIQLRTRTNDIIDSSTLLNSAFTLQITDNPMLLS
jgi:hypothetical protein|tara:strand:+ start:149 stop:613 length:465 start_codon:yes stop_codon:yes gene_type:complete